MIESLVLTDLGYYRFREHRKRCFLYNCESEGKLFLKTIQRFYRVDRKAISLMRFTFEGYEGIAGVTTVNPATGLIVINIAPGCEPDVENVLQDLQKQVYMEAVLPEDLKGKTSSDS